MARNSGSKKKVEDDPRKGIKQGLTCIINPCFKGCSGGGT